MKRLRLANELDTALPYSAVRSERGSNHAGSPSKTAQVKRHCFRAGSNPHIIAHSCRPTGAFSRSAKRFELRVRSLPWKGI